MATKYVVGIVGDLYVEALIFSDRLGHDEVGLQTFGSRDNIVSAGFCHYNDKERKMEVYGQSVGLKLSPIPDLDTYLLDVAMGNCARLSAFDDDHPPLGSHSSDARKIIDERIQREQGKTNGR